MKLTYLFIATLFLSTILHSCRNCDPVSIPYTEDEEYTEIEQRMVTLTYEIQDDKIYSYRTEGAIVFGENPKYTVYATVTNTSTYGGKFKLYATVESQGDKVDFSDEVYIAGGETKKIEISREINPFSFKANTSITKWGVEAPTEKIEKEVTKTRQVTKYRIHYPCG